jgi:lipoate-protein ligase A
MNRVQVTYEPQQGGLTNMARDRMLVAALKNHPWAARIYDWDRPWATLGRFQTPEKDLQPLTRIPWAIRPTGGRGVLHGHDVTIGLAVRLSELERISGISQSLLSRSTTRVYRLITKPIIESLQAAGIPAILGEELKKSSPESRSPDCFRVTSALDIAHGQLGYKLCGIALHLGQDAVLLQGSLPARMPDFNPEEVFAGSAPVIPTKLRGKDWADALTKVLSDPKSTAL